VRVPSSNQQRKVLTMSPLMDQLIEKVQRLPEETQEQLASMLLQELESEERWDALFADPRSPEVLSRLADQALAEHRAGS